MAESRESVDVVIIGAGHNGLTCAGYLARAGLTVKVLERRDVVGGAALTQEFHPGFRNSVYSYVVSLLDPVVIRDLDLERHGLTILERPAGSFLPLPNAGYLHLPRDPAGARAAIARHSQKDAAIHETFERRLSAVASVLREAALRPPPNLGGGWRDLLGAAGMANRLRRLDGQAQATLAELFTKSVGDYLDQWFESDALKGLYGFEGIVGNFVGPYYPGSAYVLLHHAFGQTQGRGGAWGHAKGGMGSITRAMAQSATAHGVAIEVEAPVSEVLVDGGRAVGVRLEDGRTVKAGIVAGNVNPRLLFLEMLDPAVLPDDFVRRMRGWRCGSGTFRMNVALSELPRFSCLAGVGEPGSYLNSTIDICPSLGYIQDAHDDAKRLGWARRPIVSMCIPSTLDDSLAPAGAHVASLFCQHFNPELPDGRQWDDVRETVADLIVETVDEHAPGFRASVLGRQIKSPADLERDLGLVGGDIFHGALHLDQIYSLRPAAGFAAYRSPLKGLYLCGSGAHPGGGVSGLPGRNAALRILADRRSWRRKGASEVRV